MRPSDKYPLPDENRARTDIFCIVFFLGLVFTMFGFSVKAWTSSDFHQMLHVRDSDGNSCGKDLPEYPYLYFVSPHPQSLWVTVCVRKCPQKYDKQLDCIPNSKAGCQPRNSAESEKAVQIYEAQSFFSFCLPTSQKIRYEISPALQTTVNFKNLLLLKEVWPILILSAIVSIFAAFMVFLLLRYLAKYLIYIIGSLFTGGFLALGIFLITTNQPLYVFGLMLSQTVLMILGAISLSITFFLSLLALLYRQKLGLFGNITKVSSRFVNENCLLTILSFLIFLCMLLTVVWLVLEALGFYSFGKMRNNRVNQNFEFNKTVMVLFPLLVFQFMWILTFLKQSENFLIAGTVTNWYFKVQRPFYSSLHRYYKYHIGSVLFGSLFHALFGTFKTIYNFLKTQNHNSNSAVPFCSSCCSCICCICTNFIFDWFNHSAYTLIHIYGDSYCSSVSQAFAMMAKQPIATATISSIQLVFSFVTRILILIPAPILSLAILKNNGNEEIEDNLGVIVVMSMLIALMIGSLFISLYSDSMQSLYLCFLAESGLNGQCSGTPQQFVDLIAVMKKEAHIIDD